MPSRLSLAAALRRAVALAVFVGALFVPRNAGAGERLDVQDWLARPGVRLVAVEFYATWCKPCMDAMPRWRALREKYGPRGLRVVVVNTQDPEGGCRALPFVPDESVCDLDGEVADSFRLQGKLPSAFLWSWQGNLLVAKGHIDDVERAVEDYFAAAPRVTVEATPEADPRVVDAIRERLADEGKVTVVADSADRVAIEGAKRAQLDARFDERLQCEIGKEVPPNSVLRVGRVTQGSSAFANASLYDLASGCLVASASSDAAGDPRSAARDLTGKLLAKLRRAGGPQWPVVRALERPAPRPTPVAPPRSSWHTPAGVVAVSVGVVSMGVGGAAAFFAKRGGDDIKSAYGNCLTGGWCAPQDEIDDARVLSDVANYALFGGAALTTLGVVFFATEPSTADPSALRVSVGPRQLRLEGSF
jgi:thiol-disulfide isomerase/thioredoxin